MTRKSHFLTVGNPIENKPEPGGHRSIHTVFYRVSYYRVSHSKEMRFWIHFFWEVRGSRSLDLEGCCDFDLRIKSIDPGIPSSLLVENIVAGESIAAEKKSLCDAHDTESRNSTQMRSNFVKSHYTVYKGCIHFQ